MNNQIFQSVVAIGKNGKLTISCEEFKMPEQQELLEVFQKKLRGRIHLDQEQKLVFDPYETSSNIPSVRQKEQVGQCVVTRSAKAMKISLSLPVTMSQHQMIMTVLDECTRLTDALRNGLYERMVA